MKRALIAATLASAVCGTAIAEPFDVFGTYRLPSGDSHVHISDCGDATPCGKVAWINPASVPAGKTLDTLVDANGTKILGLKLLKGFDRKSKDWRGGTIYDPKDGKTYDSRLKRLANGDLEVKGCIGPICQTQIWTPVN